MKTLIQATMAGTALLTAQAFAIPASMTTFFGEDTTTAGIALGPNAAAARADFLDNLIGVGSEDFEGFANGSTAPLNLAFPGSSGTLNATLNGNNVEIEQSGPGRFATSGSNFLEASTGSFSIDFSPGVSSFGFNGIDIGDFVTNQMTLSLALAGGGTADITVPHSLNIGNSDNATLFFGFIDTVNTISSITFDNVGGADLFAFDDMITGDQQQIDPDPNQPGEVPAPGTLLLLALGLLGIGASKRRKTA